MHVQHALTHTHDPRLTGLAARQLTTRTQGTHRESADQVSSFNKAYMGTADSSGGMQIKTSALTMPVRHQALAAAAGKGQALEPRGPALEPQRTLDSAASAPLENAEPEACAAPARTSSQPASRKSVTTWARRSLSLKPWPHPSQVCSRAPGMREAMRTCSGAWPGGGPDNTRCVPTLQSCQQCYRAQICACSGGHAPHSRGAPARLGPRS